MRAFLAWDVAGASLLMASSSCAATGWFPTRWFPGPHVEPATLCNKPSEIQKLFKNRLRNLIAGLPSRLSFTATLALLCAFVRLAVADMQKFSWRLGDWDITKYLDRYNVWPVDAIVSRSSADRDTAVTGTIRRLVRLVRCFPHDRPAMRRGHGASTRT
jgi:hypothetical protein